MNPITRGYQVDGKWLLAIRISLSSYFVRLSFSLSYNFSSFSTTMKGGRIPRGEVANMRLYAIVVVTQTTSGFKKSIFFLHIFLFLNVFLHIFLFLCVFHRKFILLWKTVQFERTGKKLQELRIRGRIGTEQTTIFFRSAWIMTKVLESSVNWLSHRLQQILPISNEVKTGWEKNQLEGFVVQADHKGS